jgi:hypothetical protein
MGTFTSPSLTDSDEYWNYAALKCFDISTGLGLLAFILIIKMNPYWADYQAFKRGSRTLAGLAKTAIIFKTMLVGLRKFISHRWILGKHSVPQWRIKYQKHDLPHAHILFWSDFDAQDVLAVEEVINVRDRKIPCLLNVK